MSESTSPIIAGFIEGLLAPVGELYFTVLFAAESAIIQTVGNSPASFLISLIGLISIEDFARNIAVGLSPSEFAVGSLAGNALGIALFYSVLDSVSHEAALESLLLAIVLVGSFVVGCMITVYRFLSRE